MNRFCILRENILSLDLIGVLSLQKFAGRCVSFLPAIPNDQLHIWEVNSDISLASQNESVVNLSPSLQEEISHWSFPDS